MDPLGRHFPRHQHRGTARRAAGRRRGRPGSGGGPSPAAEATGAPPHASLPLVALVLGIAGVVLGITVVSFFAAIPVGIVSVVLGVIARRRDHLRRPPAPRPAPRSAPALGLVAILLGITGAYFLRVIDRADGFLATVQQDVNEDVGQINGGLSRDVNRLDRTLSRDLRRFEAQNRADLEQLEQRTSAAMTTLEQRITAGSATATAAERRELAQLEARLASDLQALEHALRKTKNDTVHDTLGGLDRGSPRSRSSSASDSRQSAGLGAVPSSTVRRRLAGSSA